MAEVSWTEPALTELETIAETIALDKPEAARRLVQRIFSSVERLKRFPKLGSRVPEMPKSVYRQLVVGPCRIFYRQKEGRIFIVFVMRGERFFRKGFLR
jgi:toxin ParE1/3/4